MRQASRWPWWWVRYGTWLGPALVLLVGVNLMIASYVPPFGWDSVLTRVTGFVLLFLVPPMLLSSAQLLADETERRRRPLVVTPEGTDAFAELRGAELDAIARGEEQVTVRREALALILAGHGAMRAVLEVQGRLDRPRPEGPAGGG